MTWDFLKRPCELCGESIGSHVAIKDGAADERVGAMGLICPSMLTDSERAEVAANRGENLNVRVHKQ